MHHQEASRLALVCLLGAALAAGCEPRDGARGDTPLGSHAEGRGGGPAATAEPGVDPGAGPGGGERKGDEGSSVKKLESDRPVVDVPIEGRKPAVVALPVGATGKKPVLVAAHGRDDNAEPLCDMWRGVVGERGFVLCPRGIPSQNRPGSFTYASHTELANEIDDAVAALRAKYPDHVDEGSLVYAGFSLGSFQGVRVVASDPQKTPRVVLIEGGHDPWSDDLIESFADGGGQRVLFVTGQQTNYDRSRRVAKELEQAGIASRVVHAEGAGHVYTGDIEARVREAFDWVVEGDARWGK